MAFEATYAELAQRAVLAGPSNHWRAHIVASSELADAARRLKREVANTGLEAVQASLDVEVADACQALRAHPHATLILTADDALDEAAWRSIDLAHRRLGHRGATLLLLTKRAIGSMTRNAAHLLSWLGGSISTASPREEVELLVEAGRVGDARTLAREIDQATLGPLGRVLEPPKTSTRPATGLGDFSASARWLREHEREFEGRWVALRGEELIDCDVSRIALQERVRTISDAEDLLFVKVER